MSEPTALPPPDSPAEPPPPRRRWHLLPWLSALGFLLLAAGLVWVWRHPAIQPASNQPLEALSRQVASLEARVARLEARPEPQVPDLAPLAARIAALERRPQLSSPATAPAPDLSPLEARIAALEHRQAPDLQPLEARLERLEAKQSELTRRADTATTSAEHVARVQAAALGLAAGQKLGDLPGAPPGLAQFADVTPPTEASLRLSFPAAARAALAATRPDTAGKPLLTRLWSEAQDLVTIRQGDRVLVGDPTASVLERARTVLDAGDLQAAVSDVASLQGAAAQAMAGWLTQARSLLAARAALAQWSWSG
jgi:hypothetical protein